MCGQNNFALRGHVERIAKRKYYDSKFENARNDLKITWKLLNEVINKRKSKSSLPSSHSNQKEEH